MRNKMKSIKQRSRKSGSLIKRKRHWRTQRRKKPLIKFVLLFVALVYVALLSGCAHVPVKDFPYYGDLGQWGAEGNYTLHDEPISLNKADWDKLRFGMICTDSSNWQHWKGIIEKFCQDSNRCTYEEKKRLAQVFADLEYFNLKADRWRQVRDE
jgi:hypothetical protein